MSLTLKDFLISITALDVSTTYVIDFPPTTANGSLTTYTLEENYLRWKIPASSTEFIDPNSWKKIIIVYSSPSSLQVKTITFRRRNGIFKALTSWDSYSQTGSWSIRSVHIVNKMGAEIEISGASFPSSNNITVA